FPRAAEAFSAGAAAQPVSADAAHVDVACGAADAAGVGEGANECALALGRPAVVARLDRDGGKGGELFRRHGDADLGRVFPACHRESFPLEWIRPTATDGGL